MTEQDLTTGFVHLLGLEFVEVSPDRVVVRWTVRPELHQPYGILHGGVHCAAIETAASIAAGAWLGDRGDVVGVSNQTDFLRAVRDGVLTATATPVHRGRLQQLWLVEIRDDDERLVARGQVRLQNIDNTDRLGSASST
jgi:1,4-dihydroxy-2-naphthoyl-CoA hydrolase